MLVMNVDVPPFLRYPVVTLINVVTLVGNVVMIILKLPTCR